MASQIGNHDNVERENTISSLHVEEEITKPNDFDMNQIKKDLKDYDNLELKEMREKISDIETKLETMMGLLNSLVRGEGLGL